MAFRHGRHNATQFNALPTVPVVAAVHFNSMVSASCQSYKTGDTMLPLKDGAKMKFHIDPIAERLHVDHDLLCILCRSWNRIDKDFYHEFSIPKKNGSMRNINTPIEALKCVQKAIYREILSDVPLHPSCHGFVRGKSIITNASLHAGKEIVINLDVADFFPSISAGRIHGIFVSMGFHDGEARFLTRLVTFAGALPQGAPSSPALANIVCRRLDSRLHCLALRIKADYSRYADDLTFSGSENIVNALPLVRKIINEEGFALAERKLRIQRRGNRQEVTGLTTNSQVSVPRHIRRRLRAVMHQYKAGGLMYWNDKQLSRESFKGHIGFLRSIHRDLGNKMWYEFMNDDHEIIKRFVKSVHFQEPTLVSDKDVTWRSDNYSMEETDD
jgi:RNA-directed DNA polymerase